MILPSQSNQGFFFRAVLALCVLFSVSACSGEIIHDLEDRADRASIIEFAPATEENSVVPQIVGLFSLKKQLLQEGGVLQMDGRLLCALIFDPESGSFAMARNSSVQFDDWILDHDTPTLKIWENGAATNLNIFGLSPEAEVETKSLREILQFSFGEGGEGFDTLSIPAHLGFSNEAIQEILGH